VIEGTSHIFITDAIRHEAQADIAAIRVPLRHRRAARSDHVGGPLHFIPIGPMIAKGTIKGKQLKRSSRTRSTVRSIPTFAKWTGGWLFNYSGLRAEIDPYAKAGERVSNIQIASGKTWKPLDTEADYTTPPITTHAIRTSSTRRRCATSRSSRTRTGATSTASMSSPAISRTAEPHHSPRRGA